MNTSTDPTTTPAPQQPQQIEDAAMQVDENSLDAEFAQAMQETGYEIAIDMAENMVEAIFHLEGRWGVWMRELSAQCSGNSLATFAACHAFAKSIDPNLTPVLFWDGEHAEYLNNEHERFLTALRVAIDPWTRKPARPRNKTDAEESVLICMQHITRLQELPVIAEDDLFVFLGQIKGAVHTRWRTWVDETVGNKILLKSIKSVTTPDASMFRPNEVKVAGMFLLAALAGEVATQLGITGWPDGEASKAAKDCFAAWRLSNVHDNWLTRQLGFEE